MGIKLDVQKLEPGMKVRLIEVDCTEFDGDVLRFHAYSIPHTQAEISYAQENGTDLPAKKIVWQGNEYHAWPYDFSGVELDGTGSNASPTLSVANIDGSISALCLALQDLAQAKVSVHTTFEHYLDGQPDADQTMEFLQVWYIDRKVSENNKVIQWELSNPADLTGKMIPARQIHGVCYWMLQGNYRGPDCGYTGNAYFDINDEPTADPAKDDCGGLVKSCKLRFGADQPLSHGGFIASSLLN